VKREESADVKLESIKDLKIGDLEEGDLYGVEPEAQRDAQASMSSSTSDAGIFRPPPGGGQIKKNINIFLAFQDGRNEGCREVMVG
jgi:hypothetical protein